MNRPKQALLIVDVQNDYFTGGRMALKNPEAALANIEKVLKIFRDKKLPIIHVQHVGIHPGATFFLPDTDGVLIHKNIRPQDGEYLVVKHLPNSFFETDLGAILAKTSIKDLVVCGMMTHMCIDATVRACKDFGIAVTLLDDACATRDLAHDGKILPAETVHDVFMAALNGMFAKVVKTDALELAAI